MEADGTVDAQNAPTAPWKTLRVFHELPQGLSHRITHAKPRKAPKWRWETRIDPGIDIVSTWTPLAIGGRTTLSGVFNYTDTDVTDFSAEHFDADRVTSLTLGLPRTRWNIGVNQTEDHWTLMARLHYYGA